MFAELTVLQGNVEPESGSSSPLSGLDGTVLLVLGYVSDSFIISTSFFDRLVQFSDSPNRFSRDFIKL